MLKKKKKSVSHDASKLRVLIFERYLVWMFLEIRLNFTPLFAALNVMRKQKNWPSLQIYVQRRSQLKTKFTALFKMYSVVHRQISHTRPINDEDLGDIQVYIDEYLAYYRGIFPDVRIIIKQHLLEDPCSPMDKEVGLWYGATWWAGWRVNTCSVQWNKCKQQGHCLSPETNPLGTTRSPYLSITNYSRKTAQDKNTKVEKSDWYW